MADKSRNYSGGRYAFELDGQVAALVKKFDGMHGKSQVVETKLATSNVNAKSIANVEFDDAKVELGLSMSQPLLDWVNASMRGEHMRKAGAIIAADADGAARSRRDFVEALITEVGFPACDAASKDSAWISLSFKPENVEMKDGDESKVTGNMNVQQKLFLPSNFRLEVGGLPCATVNKVDAFTFKQAVVPDPTGDSRIQQIVPGPLTFSNLKVTGGMRDYKAWQDWFTDFVIKGNCSQDQELGGSLTWLSQNREKELARVTFSQIGIFALTESTNEAGKEGIKTWTAELYCEGYQYEVLA